MMLWFDILVATTDRSQPSALERIAFHLGWTGSIASLVSLGLTIWVLVRIGKIRRDLFERVRLDQIVGKLKACEANLTHAIRYKQPTKARSALLLAATHLGHSREFIDSESAIKHIDPVIAAIEGLPDGDLPMQSVEEVFASVKASTAELEHLSDDRAWSKQS